ncbi:arsenical pump-driving ATPase ArsA [Alicycliphilus sp. B1]|nr:arsenical pump-driving ATPase ArsA [Alicycliphilus sp. B1]
MAFSMQATAQTKLQNAFEALGTQALNDMPDNLRQLPQDQVLLRAFDTVGLQALRALLVDNKHANWDKTDMAMHPMRQGMGLADLADSLALAGHGLIMVMGKGGVGKTTVAGSPCVGACSTWQDCASEHH